MNYSVVQKIIDLFSIKTANRPQKLGILGSFTEICHLWN